MINDLSLEEVFNGRLARFASLQCEFPPVKEGVKKSTNREHPAIAMVALVPTLVDLGDVKPRNSLDDMHSILQFAAWP